MGRLCSGRPGNVQNGSPGTERETDVKPRLKIQSGESRGTVKNEPSSPARDRGSGEESPNGRAGSCQPLECLQRGLTVPSVPFGGQGTPSPLLRAASALGTWVGGGHQAGEEGIL